MNYTLRCWQRLGDILLCLPAAKFLRDQGHGVYIECLPKYHDIFQCVDYARPVEPGSAMPDETVLTMGVHPFSGGSVSRYLAYRRSGTRWQDFVYSQIYALNGCPHTAPMFNRLGDAMREEYGLPDKFILYAPTGYSQIQKHSGVAMAERLMAAHPGLPLYKLSDTADGDPTAITAKHLSHLPQIIAWAEGFATINSAPAIIAAAIGRAYTHYPQTGDLAQDDVAYLNPKAEVVT